MKRLNTELGRKIAGAVTGYAEEKDVCRWNIIILNVSRETLEIVIKNKREIDIAWMEANKCTNWNKNL